MPSRCLFAIAALSTLLSLQSAKGWEIHLRSSCDCSNPLVTLGDIAELRSLGQSEMEQLSAMELFSAPPQGQPVMIRQGDLRDMLALRSIDLIGCRLTGAESSYVRSVPKVTPQLSLENNRPGNPSLSHPNRSHGSTSPATDTSQAGYNDPSLRDPNSLPDSEQIYVAVPHHLIQRGEIIHADDVTMVPLDNPSQQERYLSSLDGVIGREATQSLNPGRAIEHRMVRKPLLVHRGEFVTVLARAGGVMVRTSARVMDDGSAGDLVKMQSPDRQSEYVARVTGVQEVEVYVAVTNVNNGERR